MKQESQVQVNRSPGKGSSEAPCIPGSPYRHLPHIIRMAGIWQDNFGHLIS